MNTPRVHVLMYHSISRQAGPTCISPETFLAQLEALAAQNYTIVSLGQVADWLSGRQTLPARAAVLTFDDAFSDFESEAAPRLVERNFGATVFVPTSWVDRRPGWGGAGANAQSLMSWQAIRELSSVGIEFGSHSCSHHDLRSLGPEALAYELKASRDVLEQNLNRPVKAFAAPYGRTNRQVREAIAQHYGLAVGVRLALADRASDCFDIPRIEMHYFRDPHRWSQFLSGNSTAKAYFAGRQAARLARALLLPQQDFSGGDAPGGHAQ